MRIPYYLAQYQQTETKTAGSTPTLLPAIVVSTILLLYVAILVFLLLGLGS